MINLLDEETFEFVKEKNAQLDLREWQMRAKKYFKETNNNAIFEVATGSGKTFIAIDIINEICKIKPDIKVLIVVPKNVILETGWYNEFVNYGFPIQKIGVYYGDVKEISQFTITNMQSINKLPMEIFDFLILDECHNMCTERLLEIFSYPFKYKLGLSATVKRLDNNHNKLLKMFDYNIFEYKPDDAIKDGVLNPFVFYNIAIKLDEETKVKYDELSYELNSIFQMEGSFEKIMKTSSPIKIKMLSLMNERKQLINNYPVKFEVVFDIIKQYNKNKIIVFNQYNEQTTKLYWNLLETGVECRVLHSGISKSKREHNLIDFKNDKYNVLLTSKVLDEGYNLPKLDMAIIMAGDSTEKQTVQRMGRVLRKKENQDSILIQLYCKGTFEERNSIERANMFKELSTNYKDIEHFEGTKIVL